MSTNRYFPLDGEYLLLTVPLNSQKRKQRGRNNVLEEEGGIKMPRPLLLNARRQATLLMTPHSPRKGIKQLIVNELLSLFFFFYIYYNIKQSINQYKSRIFFIVTKQGTLYIFQFFP